MTAAENSIALLFVFLILIVSITLFLKTKNKPKTKHFRVTRKFHYIVLYIFIGLLFVMTICAEWLYPKSDASASIPWSAESFESHIDDIDENILNGVAPDDSFLLTTRTHMADNQLILQHKSIQDRPLVYVTRKDRNDGVVEEFLYKPVLLVNNYDFSDNIKVVLPEWHKNTITFHKTPALELEFVNYADSNALNQLTKNRKQNDDSNGFSSFSRTLIVHLIVPKDMEIVDPTDEVIFVDEASE